MAFVCIVKKTDYLFFAEKAYQCSVGFKYPVCQGKN